MEMTEPRESCKPGKWVVIYTDFDLVIDEEVKYIYIVGHETSEQNEEGKAIAKICIVEGSPGINYFDKDAKTDFYAQKVINRLLELGKENNWIVAKHYKHKTHFLTYNSTL
jgi:hypothetical protein